MKNTTEDFMIQFEEYMKSNKIDINEENRQEVIDKFIPIYNARLAQKRNGSLTLSDREQADEYYEMALESEDYAYCKRMLKKAIKLNPDFIDAHAELASYIQDSVKRMETYRKIEEMALERLAAEGITKESNQGDFYGIMETRPYIRLKYRIMEEYETIGCISLAIKEAEAIIELNENDNMGARYSLMRMYAMLEQKEKAEALYNHYEEDSVPMHLYLGILHFKLQDLKESENHLRRIKKLVPTANKIFSHKNLEEEVANHMEGYYKPFSIEEIVLFMRDIINYLTEDILDFMQKCWR